MNRRFCNGMVHVIKEGENLYQLSRMYRVPLALILRANPYVDVYNLQPGQEICIPTARRPFGGMMMPPGMGSRPPRPMNRNDQWPEQREMEENDNDKDDNDMAFREPRERVERQAPTQPGPVEQRQENSLQQPVPNSMDMASENNMEMNSQEDDSAEKRDVDSETAVADGIKSLGDILNENGISMDTFMKYNNLSQIILAADVCYNLPKKV